MHFPRFCLTTSMIWMLPSLHVLAVPNSTNLDPCPGCSASTFRLGMVHLVPPQALVVLLASTVFCSACMHQGSTSLTLTIC
ncbi:hypothetical protein F4860DRAFT_481695 [Xylaria cubensis]|nr:hypothetical protein F4860DRAFT_481695 [Xylaria cubensis]